MFFKTSSQLVYVSKVPNQTTWDFIRDKKNPKQRRYHPPLTQVLKSPSSFDFGGRSIPDL